MFFITYKCDKNIGNNYITYKEFKNKIINKDITDLNFLNKFRQKYFLEYFIKENETIDNPSI